MEADDGLLLPILQPEIAGNPAVVLVHLAVAFPPVVELAGGGDSDLGWSNAATSGAELYDPVADKFSVTGTMVENREGHTATLLPDGTVLIAGGGINSFGTASAEIYHPNVLIPAPVLFSLSGNGRGQGAIWHAQTVQTASAGNPAVAGEDLSM